MAEKRKIGRPSTGGRDPNVTVRMPAKRRDALDEKAKKAGSDRSKVVNDLAAWYVKEDDAELPERPD
jgi:metal-responsive CopG/Arc/MetJ family transcriptional regulator